MRVRSHHTFRAGALSLVIVGILAGCGGSGSSSSSGSSQSGGGQSADVSGARAQLQKYKALPTFKPPGPAFDASAVRGKTIYEIGVSSEIPFTLAVEEGMKQATSAVGAKLVVWPNQGQPSQWAQGIRTAISQKADAITLLAQNPALVQPQIDAAKKAGIKVVVLRTTGEEEPCERSKSGNLFGTTCIPGPFEQAGRLEADSAIAETNGKLNALVLTALDSRSTVPLLKGLKGELKKRCPNCQARYIDVPIPDWASKIRTEVQSALVKDPSINFVIPVFDSMSEYAAPAIQAAGKANKIKIASFNGTPAILKMLQDKDIVTMDAGEGLAWVGWAAMDQTFRVLTGQKPVTTENTALRVFDASNVNETGTPPKLDKGYGAAYVSGYKKLWGVGG